MARRYFLNKTKSSLLEGTLVPGSICLSLERDGDVGDGPPCLQFLCGSGFPEGTRNDGLFNIGVYLRKRSPDTWRTEIEAYNHEYFKPPLGIAEIKEIIKSV